MSNSRTVLLAAATACLVAAGCSSSSPVTAKPPTKDTLRGIVVQQSDLPSGWTGVAIPSTNSSGNSDLQSQLLTCVGETDIKASDRLYVTRSDDFSADLKTQNVSSSATSYKSQSAVNARIRLLNSSNAESCLNKTLQESLAKKSTSFAQFGVPTLTLKAGSNGGPGSVVATATGSVTVSAQGQQATVYLDIVFIKGPLLTATVQFTGVGKPFDSALAKTVVADVAKRADAG